MAVDAIPSPTANSYCSNAYAVEVWSNDPYKQDYATVIADQDIALKSATALLDDVYGENYHGKIYDTSYALYWPRTGVTDPRTGLVNTDYTVFPIQLARATALQAYHLSKTNRQSELADSVTGVKRERVEGAVEVEYATPADQKQAEYRPVIHEEVDRIMAQFVTGGTSSSIQIMSRG